MRTVVVGVGNLGTAIVRSLLHFSSPSELTLVERGEGDRRALQETFGCHVVDQLSPEHPVRDEDLLILAVKPQDALTVCAAIAPFVSSQAVVLSVMAGVRAETLVEKLKTTKVARAMPNLGASIDQSATGYFCGEALSPSEVERVEFVLSHFGKIWRVHREDHLDALTAIAGTGPAYVCWLGQQIERAALEFGISEQDAHAIVLQTMRGTVLYLEQSSLTFAELRRQVTSPQGTTAAAMEVLHARGAEESMLEAIGAARKRARELGG